MNVLERIVTQTREDVRKRRKEVSLKSLEQALAVRGDDRPFCEALTLPGVSVIATGVPQSMASTCTRAKHSVSLGRARRSQAA